jgi:hypothetical protein
LETISELKNRKSPGLAGPTTVKAVETKIIRNGKIPINKIKEKRNYRGVISISVNSGANNLHQ